MTTALATEHASSLGDLKRIQKTVVRVVIAVQDGDGNDLCRLAAGTQLQQPLPTLQSLLLKFVAQWANMHDSLIERVQKNRFGHLPSHDVSFMDVLSVTGALMLSGLKEINNRGANDEVVVQQISDITHTLQALAMLQSSYESNPSNEELDMLSAEVH